jgi:aminoglycoside 6'-N-acetyltransferase I
VRIRPAIASDLAIVTQLAAALWPEEPPSDHAAHAASILSGKPAGAMPLVLFVAEVGGVELDHAAFGGRAVIGFIEVGLRSHADGCDTSRPAGFVEGWYVQPSYQRGGVGRALMTAAEEWARAQGAREIASDTWIDNEPSQRAHEALGFEVVDRCVNYRKAL